MPLEPRIDTRTHAFKRSQTEIPVGAIDALYAAVEAAGFKRRRQEVIEDCDAIPEVRLELVYRGEQNPEAFAEAAQHLAGLLGAGNE